MSTLTSFLGDEPGEEIVDDVATAAEPAVEAPAEPEVTAEPAVETVAAEHEPEDTKGLRSALQAERAKRNDYKGERDRLAGEMAALKAQLEAAQRPAAAAPAPVQRQEPMAVPSPVEDPAGYHAFIQRTEFNNRLNFSEALLRDKVGDDADVDAKIALWKSAAEKNPAMQAELVRQPHPYQWVYREATKLAALAEIGDDPAAFRAKAEADIRAKVRAEIEAEYAGAAPAATAAPRVTLPQSLGTARSAAPRATVQDAPAFEDIFARRKRA